MPTTCVAFVVMSQRYFKKKYKKNTESHSFTIAIK